MFQGRSEFFWAVLVGFTGVSRELQGISEIFRRFKDVPEDFQGRSWDFPRTFRGCSRGPRVLQARFRRFQGNSGAFPQPNINPFGSLLKFPEKPWQASDTYLKPSVKLTESI